ncbi:hypothetical protein [Cloacibacillus porcorum]|uniref:hypothetical protein n=1 Tax=Cloacibacillus porcorum TaxID=1197717 RepID=UPI0026725A22|nr:hypothetical protein [Cloacibacillus porcorum]
MPFIVAPKWRFLDKNGKMRYAGERIKATDLSKADKDRLLAGGILLREPEEEDDDDGKESGSGIPGKEAEPGTGGDGIRQDA